jgi:MSHA biogenesis protein MshO
VRSQSPQAGFSLLELILVIVLLGVLASGAGLLITTPIQAYNDQLRRAQLVDQAEMSLRQIARDIRRSLPNSIRLQDLAGGGWALEMANTVDGARYRDEPGGVFNTSNHVLSFSSVDTDFDFLGTLNALADGVLEDDLRVVIYNTSSTSFYTDVMANTSPGIITPATSELTLSTITLSPDDIEHHINIGPTGFQFSQSSPGQRAFIVNGPISYVCNPTAGETTLTRHSNYAFQLDQPTTDFNLAGVRSGAVATQLTACAISYDAGTAQRGGIVTLTLTLSDSTEEAVTLLHQVHVVNVP